MANIDSPHEPAEPDHGAELTPDEARQAGPGWHVFAIWAISTAAVAAALLLAFAVVTAA